MGGVEPLLAQPPDVAVGAVGNRGRGVQADPGVAVVIVVVAEERLAEDAGVSQGPEPVRKAGAYFIVLNCDSLYGLSLLTWGRSSRCLAAPFSSSVVRPQEAVHARAGAQ